MAEDDNKEDRGPGRPPLFDSPEQLEKAVNEFIAITPKKELTITGLAMYLGFESRQSFYDYEVKPEFTYIIKKARLAVENGYELSLRSQSVTGAIFALKNMGWKDKTETAISTPPGESFDITLNIK
jgi:hypothetical protein